MEGHLTVKMTALTEDETECNKVTDEEPHGYLLF